jgi:hypothetical protein
MRVPPDCGSSLVSRCIPVWCPLAYCATLSDGLTSSLAVREYRCLPSPWPLPLHPGAESTEFMVALMPRGFSSRDDGQETHANAYPWLVVPFLPCSSHSLFTPLLSRVPPHSGNPPPANSTLFNIIYHLCVPLFLLGFLLSPFFHLVVVRSCLPTLTTFYSYS